MEVEEHSNDALVQQKSDSFFRLDSSEGSSKKEESEGELQELTFKPRIIVAEDRPESMLLFKRQI